MRHMRASTWLLASTLVSATFRGASAKMAVRGKKKQLKTHSMRCPKPIKSGQLSEWACQITETLSNAIKRYRYGCRYSVSVRCCVVRACTLLGPINNHIWQLISSVRAAAILLHSVIYATFIWGPAEMLHISVSSWGLSTPLAHRWPSKVVDDVSEVEVFSFCLMKSEIENI